MRFRQTMGVDVPFPGISSFQAALSAVHFAGKLPIARLPADSGPRHAGQSPRVGMAETRMQTAKMILMLQLINVKRSRRDSLILLHSSTAISTPA
jgi:hypothetical protein